MKDLRAFEVGIISLKLGAHQYDFDLDDSFFSFFEDDLLQQGSCKVMLSLDKNEQLIHASFDIKGTVRLICDRSLDAFDYPLDLQKELIYKFDDQAEELRELDEGMVLIARNTQRLNFASLLYEYIALAIPMKKIHPRYEEEDRLSELEGDSSKNAKFIYSSEEDETEKTQEEIDPRWAALKSLKQDTQEGAQKKNGVSDKKNTK